MLGSAGLLAETIRPTLTPRLFPVQDAPQPEQPAEQYATIRDVGGGRLFTYHKRNVKLLTIRTGS